MFRHFIWLVASGTVLFGCGSDDRPAEQPSTPAVDISGRWTSACFDQGGGSFVTLDFDVSAAEWALDYVVHADAACHTPLVTVHIAGPYSIEGSSDAVSGAYDARFGFSDKTITPHASPIVDALTSGGCGAGPWQIDEAQSVLDEGCAPFGQHPVGSCPADYDIVVQSGDELRFGARPADNDMCTPDKRPSEPSPVALARR